MTQETAPHILVVDDEHFIRDAMQLYFESNGFRVTTAQSGEEALAVFGRTTEPIDIAILDLIMPGTHGIDLLKTLKAENPDVGVIIATGCGSMNNAIEALRYGACDYITKPIVDFDEDLLRAVQKALHARRRQASSGGLARGLKDAGLEASSPSAEAPRTAADRKLQVFDGLNQLLARHEGQQVSPGFLEDVWSFLKTCFGIDAALVVHHGPTDEWECLASQGFNPVPTPRDLWHCQVAHSVPSLDGGLTSVSAAGMYLHGAPAGAPQRRGAEWTELIQLPLCLAGDRDVLLLLFFRKRSGIEPKESPLALVSAALSFLLSRDRTLTALGLAAQSALAARAWETNEATALHCSHSRGP
jgi:DNA-binding response OmpR family regulator